MENTNIKMYQEFIRICEMLDDNLDRKTILENTKFPRLAQKIFEMEDAKKSMEELTGLDKERKHFIYIKSSLYIEAVFNSNYLRYEKFLEKYKEYGVLLGKLYSDKENTAIIRSMIEAKSQFLAKNFSDLISYNMLQPVGF